MEDHFRTWSQSDHVNREGFDIALGLMDGDPKLIVETGTSAWGTDSTRLWDGYVRNFGGEFWSVDVSSLPRRRLRRQVCPQTHLVVGDSVTFLESLVESRAINHVDICYLDSWDVDWEDPDPSAEHGLREWRAIEPLMRPGSLLIVDDSPVSTEWVPRQFRSAVSEYASVRGFLPGKGALIERELKKRSHVRKIWHKYNVVYQFGAGSE